MLNCIWLALMISAVVIGGCTGQLQAVTNGAFDSARTAVMVVALPLLGIMALWLGIMRLAERSGMVQLLARFLRPVLVWLFPDVPAEHPAMGSMLMTIAANMLGLSNAATPLGLRAMKDLDALNPRPGTASNAMCTFLAISTSSVQLIPVTAIGILAVNGSTNPSAIIGTAFLATLCAAVSAIAAVKFLQKLPPFQLPPVTAAEQQEKAAATNEPGAATAQPVSPAPVEGWGAAILGLYLAIFIAFFFALTFPGMFRDANTVLNVRDGVIIRGINTISLLAIPFLLSFFPLYAAVRRVKVYEEFVEGAREGFQVILRIIPYLVAILVAFGMFQNAGGMQLLKKLLLPIMTLVHFPPELLPLALIRPISGGATMAVFAGLVHDYGPDSLLSRTAGTIYGSTETTFYVVAVYFGVVNIKRTRHAIPAGLVADIVGVIASVIICRLVFR